MSNMYAIKDTTLIALGDAVRSKTSKYTSVTDIGDSEPFYSITLDMSQVNWKGSNNDLNYQYDLDFVTLLGDKYSYTSKLYYKFEYETNNEKTFSVYIRDSRSNDTMFMSAYMNPSTEGYMAYTKGYTYRLQLNARQSSLDAGDTLTFTLRLWPCDANNMFIGLNKYTPLEMAEIINEFETIPTTALTLTGNCNYRFANGGYDWLIKQCGDKITTKDIDSMDNMFASSNVETIPFEINGYNGVVNVMNCFNVSKIKQLPKINLPKIGPLQYMFNNTYYLREISDDNWNVGAYSGHTGSYDNHTSIFAGCYSLRYITPKLLSNIWNVATGYYYSFYYGAFTNCYVLDEIVNLPVASAGYTSNAFGNSFNNCGRLKDMIFETNENSTAKTAQWKSQTIDLSNYVGYVYQRTYILNYNSGITADKQVTDDATYQALKNDPDWFSIDINYSRYNHDSAVNTINSLPDTSAYGTNTIKFKGQAGALTDGGAINTLTEEEIAVATAKGWTVSLS